MTPDGGHALAAERVVAVVRLAVVALFVLGELVPHPAHDVTALVFVASAYGISAVALLAAARVRAAPAWLREATIVWDVAAITALTALSGGPFSYARNAYFLIPVIVALRYRPPATAAAGLAATAAYVIQAVLHERGSEDDAHGLIAVHAGYLLAVVGACVALSALLERRTARLEALAEQRRELLGDALDAAARERRLVAEAIHDEVIQLLLTARHDVQAGQLDRADTAIAKGAAELRRVLQELHPYVLDEAGLGRAVELVAEQAAARAGFTADVDVDEDVPREHHALLHGLVRELVTNAAKHARASRVIVRVGLDEDAVVLMVRDDGIGLGGVDLDARRAEGHIGLASQRARVEAAGGELDVAQPADGGLAVTVRLPVSPPG